MPNASRCSDTNSDLHAIVDPCVGAIEFRVVSHGRIVRVDVRKETIKKCFGVADSQHGLLMAYEAHRSQIDAAVRRRATGGGTGIVMVRPMDL